MRIGNCWVTGKVVNIGLDITSSGNVFKSYRVKSGDNIYFGLSNSLSCVVGEDVNLKAYVSKSSKYDNVYFMRRIEDVLN